MKKLLSVIVILLAVAAPLSQQRKPAYVYDRMKINANNTALSMYFVAHYGPDSAFCKKMMKVKYGISGNRFDPPETTFSEKLISIPARDSIPDTNFVK
jgi:hypothetical protein